MTSCVLCDAAAYPIEAEMSRQELAYMTNGWLKAEFEYVQRQAREITSIDNDTKSYAAFVTHRLGHLLDEVERRMSLGIRNPGAAVSQDTIKAIKDRLPLERVIGQDRILRKAGRLFLAHCPWHEDTQPSLTVYPDSHWFCYSCQTGGDVFDWLMAIGQRGFADALGAAAIMAGVELHPRPKPSVSDESSLLT